MRIIWLVNILLPEAAAIIGRKALPYGGWLISASEDVAADMNVELAIICPLTSGGNLISGSVTGHPFSVVEGQNKRFYLYPSDNDKVKLNDAARFSIEKIINDFKPDIVHVFGSEFPHSLVMTELCKEKGITGIVSIQGLVSIYATHYLPGLPVNVQRRYTFRDLVRRDNLLHQKKVFAERGENEVKTLRNAGHLIGRTEWDRTCSSLIVPEAEYHFCNETLRDIFYQKEWDIEACERNSIFISSAILPLKGVHFMLEALKIILKEFPDARLYISGPDVTGVNGIRNKLKVTSYGKYLNELISDNGLRTSVVFTGLLNEEDMCGQYLKSNVFVCPSSIENSPNSLGEAMILGVPCVASFTGGIPDMLENGSEGFLYQHDAPYMLAGHVCKILRDEDLAVRLSRNARKRALRTHDRNVNSKRLLEIYSGIIKTQGDI